MLDFAAVDPQDGHLVHAPVPAGQLPIASRAGHRCAFTAPADLSERLKRVR